MEKTPRMKCRYCGHWNRIQVNKIFVEQPSSEPKVKVLIPMYEPLETVKCKKCGKIIAEPKELIGIRKKKLLQAKLKHGIGFFLFCLSLLLFYLLSLCNTMLWLKNFDQSFAFQSLSLSYC